MQQFTVPQFIDVEAKIIGPITVRQFVLMLVGSLIGFIMFKVADFSLFVFIAVLDLAITGTLAFLRVNGMPMHFFLLNLFQTLKRPSLRVWAKTVSDAEIRMDLKREKEGIVAPEIASVRRQLEQKPLAQLALIVDTGGVYRGEET